MERLDVHAEAAATLIRQWAVGSSTDLQHVCEALMNSVSDPTGGPLDGNPSGGNSAAEEVTALPSLAAGNSISPLSPAGPVAIRQPVTRLPSAVLDGLAEALMWAGTPLGRAEIIAETVGELYDIMWELLGPQKTGPDHTQPAELASLSLTNIEAEQHLQRMHDSRPD